MKETLTLFTAYNHWANQELIDFLDKQPKQLLEQDVPSSFRSVSKTILHIWDAELIWLSRLKGQSMNFWPSQQFNEKVSLEGLLEVSKNWEKLVEEKDSNFFKQKCFYKSIAGKEYNQEIYTIIMHCMNHSTFHRGQVITLLRSLGIIEGIPETDMIAFTRKSRL